jgi:hypothetical protein
MAMSGYLTRLLARAAPAVSEQALPVDAVHPRTAEPSRLDADPFENTVIDPPVWPSAAPSIAAPPSRAAMAAPVVGRSVPDRVSAPEPSPAGPRDTQSPLAPPRDRRIDASAPERVDADAPSIAETLRPVTQVQPAMHETPAAVAPMPAEPRPVVDRLTIADRFMSTVLPAPLLPSEVHVEHTREVVRETTDVRTAGPVITPMIQPAARAITGDIDPPAAGLVIGSLRVTVVPPAAAPAAAAARPATASPRVVVNRSAPPAPGVPAFSRFG